MWYSPMPDSVLYGAIGVLSTALVALGTIWVRAHDKHMQWAAEKITEHERLIALMQATSLEVKDDIKEIKLTLRDMSIRMIGGSSPRSS